ncbi:DUF899 family protein [Paenisporosarcina indica]|uniref:DUF899 family protein n=1 Tax=Paenisporosarcina indica TaxID=650093 RepID=UPI00094FC6F8|nr:DUF899 family protein [Paenisporosarcina indica]
MSSEDIHYEIEQLEQEILEKKKQLVQLRKSVPEQKVENYQFVTSDREEVSLHDLFQEKDELILIHNMGHSCSYCTMWADGFNGIYEHLIQKAAFVLSSPDTPEVQEDFAASRGWKFLMVSTKGTTFKQDLGFEKDGYYMPGVSTFRKDVEGNIYHHAKAPLGPRDDYNVVWHLFDLLPSGSEDFHPKKRYNSQSLFHITNNIAVQVKDYDKAINFYENILGMKLERSFEKETKFSVGGNHLFIEDSKSENVFFEFAVKDFQHARDKLVEHGCIITKDYHEKSVLVADPFGLKFHLFEIEK